MSTANSVNSGLDCASPESIMDPTNLTAIGDQYSLGCVLYYFLTAQYPFPDGTAVEKMMAHQTKQPAPIKDLRPDAPDDLVFSDSHRICDTGCGFDKGAQPVAPLGRNDGIACFAIVFEQRLDCPA